jgi:hypothetical protein
MRMKRGPTDTALEEALRLKKIRSLWQFFGSGIWEGDLSEMREDDPRRERSAPPRTA